MLFVADDFSVTNVADAGQSAPSSPGAAPEAVQVHREPGAEMCESTVGPCESTVGPCESNADMCESKAELCEFTLGTCESNAETCEFNAVMCDSEAEMCESTAECVNPLVLTLRWPQGRYKKLCHRVVFPMELKMCNTADDAKGTRHVTPHPLLCY
jgi:hypothetical protein